MNRRLLSLLLLLAAVHAHAHRLDEYLQATRIGVTTNQVDLSIDLTPGVAIFDQLFLVFDQDHDRQVSPKERKAYANQMLEDLKLTLDNKPLEIVLRDVAFPPMIDARAGFGVIRLKAMASFHELAPGEHTLSLKNSHLSAISVYLVNALIPKDGAIQIVGQNRNDNQSDYELKFVRR